MPRRTRKPAEVREPIQVYLTKADRALLDRTARASGLSRAEVLRRGLRQYQSGSGASEHPVLTFLDEMAAGPWPADMPTDVAERHDAYLAESYMSRPRRKRPKA